jgi:hypothetical protein
MADSFRTQLIGNEVLVNQLCGEVCIEEVTF